MVEMQDLGQNVNVCSLPIGLEGVWGKENLQENEPTLVRNEARGLSAQHRTVHTSCCLMSHLRDQEGGDGGEQGCVCVGWLAVTTSFAYLPTAFLNHSFLYVGFPQTWAWVQE